MLEKEDKDRDQQNTQQDDQQKKTEQDDLEREEIERNQSEVMNSVGEENSEPHYKEKVIERVVEREHQDNTLGVISLVTGIAGLVFFFCCFGIDLVLGIVALVTGILGHRNNQSYSLAGLIMGAIVLGLNVLVILGFMSLRIFDALL